MPDALHVIALVSGGKDSFFSMLHCLANGHKIVALANLFPPAVAPSNPSVVDVMQGLNASEGRSLESPQDLDSFMYQTAGHTLIPLYADVLGLPLYRQEIIGTAVDSSKSYDHQVSDPETSSHHLQDDDDDDETECLIPLLKRVIASHPKANAVCSGAILSTYQRTRVESIAIRLGLIPLSYLWQYPSLPSNSPGSLLDDMAAVGFDVRVVKVASGGLDEDLLWCNLMNPSVRRKVQKAVQRFGGSVLGEGGEYETIVIDGPSPVWQKRIQVDETKMQRCVEHGSSGNAFLQFGAESGHALAKELEGENRWPNASRPITLWDKEFERLNILQTDDVVRNYALHCADPGTFHLGLPEEQQWNVHAHQSKIGSLFYLSNLTSPSAGPSAIGQMQSIKRELVEILNAKDRSTDDIIFSIILLRSISADFTTVNTTYGQLFGKPNPPARITVSTFLPPGVNLMLSVVVDMADRERRQGLHIQSRSYWTPANIGPYSQAISVRCDANTSLVYVAGQIPLVPATMQVFERDVTDKLEDEHVEELLRFQHQACLSLQHLWRIGLEVGIGWWTGAVAYIAGGENVQAKAHIAYDTWRKAHGSGLWEQGETEVNELDAWDKTYGGLGSLANHDQDHRALPDYAMLVPGNHASHIPGFLAVQVDELPRNCEIEWQSLGVAGGDVNLCPTNLAMAEVMNFGLPSTNRNITYIPLRHTASNSSRPDLINAVRSVRDQILPWLGTSELAASYLMTIYTPYVHLLGDIGAQIVPCKAVWGPKTEQLMAGIVMQWDAVP